MIRYLVRHATSDDIYFHLRECSEEFAVSLEDKVDLREYSNKIARAAVTFEAWDDDRLIGLVAVYFNAPEIRAYITSVSVAEDYVGRGIASLLLILCICRATRRECKSIRLKVERSNDRAIALYERFRFDIQESDDPNILLMEMKIAR